MHSAGVQWEGRDLPKLWGLGAGSTLPLLQTTMYNRKAQHHCQDRDSAKSCLGRHNSAAAADDASLVTQALGMSTCLQTQLCLHPAQQGTAVPPAARFILNVMAGQTAYQLIELGSSHARSAAAVAETTRVCTAHCIQTATTLQAA
jgi:hypothetical protein